MRAPCKCYCCRREWASEAEPFYAKLALFLYFCSFLFDLFKWFFSGTGESVTQCHGSDWPGQILSSPSLAQRAHDGISVSCVRKRVASIMFTMLVQVTAARLPGGWALGPLWV